MQIAYVIIGGVTICLCLLSRGAVKNYQKYAYVFEHPLMMSRATPSGQGRNEGVARLALRQCTGRTGAQKWPNNSVEELQNLLSKQKKEIDLNDALNIMETTICVDQSSGQDTSYLGSDPLQERTGKKLLFLAGAAIWSLNFLLAQDKRALTEGEMEHCESLHQGIGSPLLHLVLQL